MTLLYSSSSPAATPTPQKSDCANPTPSHDVHRVASLHLLYHSSHTLGHLGAMVVQNPAHARTSTEQQLHLKRKDPVSFWVYNTFIFLEGAEVASDGDAIGRFFSIRVR